jgi:TM2 domain-containing membrane protein YozV
MPIHCPQCGAQNNDFAQTCQNCHYPLPSPQQQPPPGYQDPYGGYPAPYGNNSPEMWKQLGADKKMAAGICGILLGSLGVHKFILGYKTEGIILLLATLLTCGFAGFLTGILGIVEGVIYLTKSDEEFVRTYIQGKRNWF